jgi:signal transduction histidine kinase
VGAVLRLEASLEAFQEIATLRGQVLMLSAVVAGLMVTVALIFHRLIRLLARVEANAAHRDRLQAMGLLTAGIAHEIRNPLGIIRSLAEAIQGDFSEDDPGREMMGDIVGEVERLNQLVTQYLAFARPDMAAGEGFAQPADIVRAVANLVQKDKRETSPIEIQIDSELPVVTMGATALKQVLLNLVMNAREASPPEKPIRIRGRALRGGSEVEIEVADQGPGISPRDLKRVFDPFFTTKTRGSGLGLPICRFLVDECKGQISIQSEPGKGTSARVVLPAQRKS